MLGIVLSIPNAFCGVVVPVPGVVPGEVVPVEVGVVVPVLFDVFLSEPLQPTNNNDPN